MFVANTLPLAHARVAAETAERYGAATYIAVTFYSYAWALVRAGEAEAADEALQRCAEKTLEMNGAIRAYHPVRVEASLALGDLERARREADKIAGGALFDELLQTSQRMRSARKDKN